MEFPAAFAERMREMLGEEYAAFAAGWEGEREQGLRLNLLKTDRETFLQKNPFHLEPVPWAAEGFYYSGADRPGRHPFHDAGVYYIQEPSAMAVAELLDPKPGQCILDLCAAPGGKTTQIASRLQGGGFLLSNEIHPARARILSQNVERMGIRNAVVTNEEPAALARRFPGFFDGIVVDAPCSGEGMFRKEEAALREWSPENVERCARRQQEILEEAARMLRPGGRLVYSTCTFAPQEDEESVSRFLASHPDFSLEETSRFPGFAAGVPSWGNGEKELEKTVRIWPHRARGEGHFIAVLRKAGGEDGRPEERRESGWLKETAQPRISKGRKKSRKRPAGERGTGSQAYLQDRGTLENFAEFCRSQLLEPSVFLERQEFVLFGDDLYLLPPQMPSLEGLRVLRPGLHLGSLLKNRFEPAHALAMALTPGEVKASCDLNLKEAEEFLRGAALPAKAGVPGPGWVLMTVEGYSLGWAKLSGGLLKNHYPKGLRRQGG